MPSIQALHGLRYDLGHVGALSDVVAPPYDVIDAELQKTLYLRHPANVVRLILNREEPGDDERSNRYSRAAGFLKNWQKEGVLVPESQASVYVYQQQFVEDAHEYTRSGFMCRVRLERFDEGKIFAHEETHSAAKADRLRLFSACKANLSQIFGIHPDPDDTARQLLDQTIAEVAPARSYRSSASRSPTLASRRREGHFGVDRDHGPQAGFHSRRPSSLRDRL